MTDERTVEERLRDVVMRGLQRHLGRLITAYEAIDSMIIADSYNDRRHIPTEAFIETRKWLYIAADKTLELMGNVTMRDTATGKWVVPVVPGWPGGTLLPREKVLWN